MNPDALTRHFYVMEEVYAALRHACVAGRESAAAFWLQELIDSEEIGMALAILVETYIMYYGPRHLGWLRGAYEAFKMEDISVSELHAACTGLCRLQGEDHSFIALHLMRAADIERSAPPDHITTDPRLGPGLLGYFTAAAHQGKARAAFWAAAGLSEAELEQGLMTAASAHPVRAELFQIVRSLPSWACLNLSFNTLIATSLMVVGIRPDHPGLKPMTFVGKTSYAESRAEWEALLGRRARRQLEPHWLCYYLETRRGRTPYTANNLGELRALGLQWDTIPRLAGCTYWKRIADEVAEGAEADPDDAWTSFCRIAFPDDIPDEWSLADQKKSHGDGHVGGPDANANIRKWIRKFDLPHAHYTYGLNFDGILAAIEALPPVPPENPWSAIGWLASLKLSPALSVAPEQLARHDKIYEIPQSADQSMNNLAVMFNRQATIRG